MKIVVIGAGSSYTPELIEGFIKRSHMLRIDELVFVDIQDGSEKMNIIYNLTTRMISKAGLFWKLSKTLNRQEALADADYVITQLRVGLLDARIKDEEISFKHGVLGQETNGAGGIFKGLRTIPVILDIIKDMQQLCPKAWLINFANPAGMITEAVFNYTDFRRFISLCNVPVKQMIDETELLNTSEEELFFHFAGINHFVWHKVYDNNGDEITKKVKQLLYESNKMGVANIDAPPFDYDQYMNLDSIPCYYHPYYYLSRDMLAHGLEDYKKNGTRAKRVLEIESELFELYKDENLNIKPPQLELRGGAHYSDAACELVCAIANDSRKMMVVNTQNNGAITNLKNNNAVEISCIITKNGPKPITFGQYPSAEGGYLQMMKSMEELVCKASLTGKYEDLIQAFNQNLLIDGTTVSEKLIKELLLAHEQYLPNFKETIDSIKSRI